MDNNSDTASQSETFLIVLNTDAAQCVLCDVKLFRGDGVILQVCGHIFCKTELQRVYLVFQFQTPEASDVVTNIKSYRSCLRKSIIRSVDFDVPCPLVEVEDDCTGHVLLTEIKGVLSSDAYADYLELSGRLAAGPSSGSTAVIREHLDSTLSHFQTQALYKLETSAANQLSQERRTRLSTSGANAYEVPSGASGYAGARGSYNYRTKVATGDENGFGHSLTVLCTTEDSLCGFCADFVPASKGIMLQACLHTFCRDCLKNAIIGSDGGNVSCPASCGQFLYPSEIKSIAPPAVHQEYIKKGFELATRSLPKFHCKTAGCEGVCLLDLPDHNKNKQDRAKIFPCPLCNKQNCLECEAIHEGIPCDKWKSLRAQTDKSVTDAELLEKSEDVGLRQIRMTMQQNLAGFSKDNLALYYEAAERLMENIMVLPTLEEFECVICSRMNSEVETGGIVLQQCSHTFCRECLQEVVKRAEEIPIPCPHPDCGQFLTQAEFKNLATPEVFEKHVRWGWSIAQDIIQRKFTCLKSTCEGFWEIQDDQPAGTYICPLCQSTNCVKCNAIHDATTCAEYQEKLRLEAEKEKEKIRDAENRIVQQKNEKISEAQVEGLIKARSYMRCPFCGFVCEKISGCAHVTCLNRGCKKPFNWYS